MMKRNIFFVGLFFMALVLCSAGVLALAVIDAEVNIPVAGTNTTSSVVLNCTYANATDGFIVTDPNATSDMSNWSFLVGVTETPITVTGLTCGNNSCSATASASALTDGIGLNITCSLSNDSVSVRGGGNATNLDFYTSTPACSFGIDKDVVEVQDAIGIEISSNASTKDPLSTLSYAWVLWREDNTQSTTSASGDPTFSEDDFDQLGTFTLGLSVTDRWFNTADCTNQTIFVKGRDGDVGAVLATGATQKGLIEGVSNTVLIGSLSVLFILMVAIAIVIIQKSKRR